MPYVFTSSVLQGDGTYIGHVYYRPYGASADIEVALPAGVVTTGNPPCFVVYRGRLYILGQFQPDLIFTEHNTLHTVGLISPQTIPTLTATGTGAAIVGSAVSAKEFITFRHKIGDQIIHESNPGGATAVVSASTYGFQASGLPTTSPDPRVNAIAGYRSVDGAKARFAWERPLGVTSVIDNVPTLQLGEPLSTDRGVPPASLIAAVYDERTWWVDPVRPQNLNYSLRGEPESVNPLSTYPTQGGEAITAVWRHSSDQLLIGCANCMYDIQSYGDNDYRMRRISSIYGVISPLSCVTIGDTTWFASQYGPAMYNGGFVFLAENLRDYWAGDYAANRIAYERAIGTNDPVEHVYRLDIELAASPKSFAYVGAYLDVLREGRANPRWVFDVEARPTTAAAVLQDAVGRRLNVYKGSDDGHVRLQNVAANADDDGDTYLKKYTRESRHDYFEDEGGDRNHGKKHIDLTLHLKNENQAATLKLFSGADTAPAGLVRRQRTVPAGALAGKVARTEYHFHPKIAGEGLTRRIEIGSPVGIEDRGDSGSWIDGQKSRRST